MPVVVAINHFVTDTEAEVQAVKDFVAGQGSEAIISQHWEFGGKGAEALATRVAEIADADMANFAPIYADEMPLAEKIQTICKRIYRADEALMDQKIRNQLKDWEGAGLWALARLYGQDPIQLQHGSESARRACGPLSAGA